MLNRALHAFRLATADPYVNASVAGRRSSPESGTARARRSPTACGRTPASCRPSPPGGGARAALAPQARLAAVLNGRDAALACEELTLRARLDLDHGRDREAALQVLVALDAALAELAGRPRRTSQERLAELRGRRDPVAVAAQAALAGPLSPAEREAVEFTVSRIEAALRARAVARASQSPAPARTASRSVDDVAAHPHGGMAVKRRRALGEDRDLPTAVERQLGQLRDREHLERGPDAQHQVGAGGEPLARARSRRPAASSPNSTTSGFSAEPQSHRGTPSAVPVMPGAHVSEFVP